MATRVASNELAEAADSGNALWLKLLEELHKQFPGKPPLEEKQETFKEFLEELEAGESKEDLALSLLCSCAKCTLFDEDFAQSKKVVLEKCEKIANALAGPGPKLTKEQLAFFTAHAATAWSADYRDNNRVKVIDMLLTHVRACNRDYQKLPLRFHSPYVALCQSSGWGKSRLLNELGRQIPVLYLSFLKRDSAGLPKRTQRTIDNLTTLTRIEAGVYSLNIGMWLKTIRHVDQLFSAVKDQETGMINLDEQPFDWQKLQQEEPPEKVNLTNSLVVIAFDEANEMLEEKQRLFRATRHMLKELHSMTHGKIFGVMADTNSRIFNFAPKESDDPSAKDIKDPPNLLPPFVLGGFSNCFKLEVDSRWNEPQSILGFGRPLWGAFFEKDLNNIDKWDSGVAANYAADKLCGGQIPSTWSSEHYLQSLSCMFARIGVYLNPSDSVTWCLTAKHMATLLAVSSDRETVLVTYTSEPVLAMGAALLWTYESVLTDHLLPSFRHAFLQGLVLEGDLGEIVACVLMLLIMDKMSDTGYYYGEFFSLDIFLQLLGAEQGATSDLRNKVPASARIGFGHFIHWHRDAKETDLPVLLKRRAAVILKRGQKGADLLLPLWWERVKSGDTSVNYGFVLVQVKNCVQTTSLVQAGHKLSNDFVFKEINSMKLLPSVKVLLDVGLAAQRKNGSTCHRLSLIKKRNVGHVFECKKRDSTGCYKEKAKETVSKSKAQFSTDFDFFMLSISGFDHLSLINNVQGKKKEINESIQGKVQESEGGEADKSSLSETNESKASGVNERKVEKVKDCLKSLLVGPINANIWYKEKCFSKKLKNCAVTPNFFENVLVDNEEEIN